MEQQKETHKSTERRRYTRYPSDRGVQCWKIPGLAPVWGKLQDLSPEGCFIETADPFPVGSQVRVLLMLFGQQLRVEGQVRVSKSKRGMGVMFGKMKPEDIDRLRDALIRMGAPQKQLAPDWEMMVRAIEDWFQTHDNLPHATFLQIRDTGELTDDPEEQPGANVQ